MSAGDVVRNAARLVARHGETMVLAREGEATTIALMGKRIPGTTEQGGNSAEQQSFRVKIAPTELLASAWAVKAPSASTDSITVGGIARTVLDVRPLGDGATVALYELDVAG